MKTRSMTGLVGKTPLFDFGNGIYAKLEFFNPSGSIKDRMVKHIIESAERKGALGKGSLVCEATSGNTGIALAMISASMGYKAKVFMPEQMSEERKAIMTAYGAELVLTKDLEEAISMAEEEAKNGAFCLNQFRNLENVEAHYRTTAQEIIRQMRGKKIGAFIAGIGTGGTLMGVAKALMKKNPKTEIIGVLPKDEKNEIEGIGKYYREIVDEGKISRIIKISNEEAKETQSLLMEKYGIFAGISSGANYRAAEMVKEEGIMNVVTVLPDSGDRYISRMHRPQG